MAKKVTRKKAAVKKVEKEVAPLTFNDRVNVAKQILSAACENNEATGRKKALVQYVITKLELVLK